MILFDLSDTSHSKWQYIGFETKKSFMKGIYYDGTQISACFSFPLGIEVRINIVCFAFIEPIESIQYGQGELFRMALPYFLSR